MTTEPCSRCETPTEPLAMFPGHICLACYEKDHENDSPEELFRAIMDGFGGRS